VFDEEKRWLVAAKGIAASTPQSSVQRHESHLKLAKGIGQSQQGRLSNI
jgi:hypothetical protein